MLTNEVLFKAKELDRDFLLLKLDSTMKAFDCIGWNFLYILLDRIGFGSKFIQMFKAINASVSSSILIQGRLTDPILLMRSFWKGCPLSPLLYLLATNVLSMMMNEAIDLGLIKGVPIEETGNQVIHGLFVDDTNAFIEAKR